MDAVFAIGSVKTSKDRPINDVSILKCGQVST